MKRQYTKPLMLAIPVEQQHLLAGSGDDQSSTQNVQYGGMDNPTTSSPTNNNVDQSIWSNGADVVDDDQCAKGRRPFSEYMW